jgi:predicted protein tyrosine phosphatase
MTMIHVCALATLQQTVLRTRAQTVLTLLRNVERHMSENPVQVARHLRLELSDIAEDMPGQIVPADEHVVAALDFVRAWDRREPMVIHCYAGVSRSTAAAYAAACLLRPQADERALAEQLREASPTATPNMAIVAHADRRLGRGGRMVEAIAAIGRGAEVTDYLGIPFSLAVADGDERVFVPSALR